MLHIKPRFRFIQTKCSQSPGICLTRCNGCPANWQFCPRYWGIIDWITEILVAVELSFSKRIKLWNFYSWFHFFGKFSCSGNPNKARQTLQYEIQVCSISVSWHGYWKSKLVQNPVHSTGFWTNSIVYLDNISTYLQPRL